MINKVDLKYFAVQKMSDAVAQFDRSGVWGTCAACPRDEYFDLTHPELCAYRLRYDHRLNKSQLGDYVIGLVRDGGR